MSSKSKTGFTKRLISIVLAVMLVAALMVSAVVNVSAANAAVNDVKNSILQVRMYYTKDNVTYPISSGTSFLINEDTILTCSHVVNIDSTLAHILDVIEGNSYNPSSVGYEVVVNKDVTIRANLKKQSVEDDFAILTLSEPIGGKSIVKIADSDTVESTDQVYALGFPGTIAKTQTTNTYNTDDVTITEGIVQKVGEINGTDFIISAADLTAGVSGGPLVNADGAVVAINQSYLVRWDRTALNDADYDMTGNYYHVAMHQITDVLDALNITWTAADGAAPVEETSADKPTEAPAAETEAPVVSAAEPTLAPAGTTSSNGGMNGIVIAIIALVVVLIIAVVVIIIVVSKKNKNNGPKPVTPPTPPQAPPVRPTPPQPPYGNRPMPSGGAPTVPSNDGAGETSVLNDGAGETSVLGGGMAATGFTLVRKSNNEKVNINKPEFTIGKERRRVDYCIANNNSVSRVHAKLRVRGGVCYIADLGSTNCTYVNGTKLSPNQEVALKKGDKIKISDEEFEMN